MTETDWNALAERCEQADGPDRGLEADIELATGNWGQEHYAAWHWHQGAGEAANPPLYEPVPPQPFTASVDATLTLAGDWTMEVTLYPDSRGSANGWHPRHVHMVETKRCATPALALLAACCRARGQAEPSDRRI